MREAMLSLTIVFLFVFISLPTLAYSIDTEYNFTTTDINIRSLRCVNSTTDNEVYCFLIGEDVITRFNATLTGSEASCSKPLSFVPYGAIALNESAVCTVYGACMKCFNTTVMSGTCSEIATYSVSANYIENGVFTKNNNWSYYSGAGIFQGNTKLFNVFYPQYDRGVYNQSGDVHAPNPDTNSTIYFTYRNNPFDNTNFMKTDIYENGEYQYTTDSVEDLWGLSADMPSSIIEVGGIKYMYLFWNNKYGEVDVLYRVNFSEALETIDCGGYTDGAWCVDYNLTYPCCYSNSIEDWTTLAPPQCSYDLENCYDIYAETPNPFDASKRAFTVYNSSVSGCVQEYNSCPTNYMCVQYKNPLTYQYEGKVECYNGNNGSAIYYNESGGLFNGTEYTLNLTEDSCTNPSIYTNPWTCEINYCQWCPMAQACTTPDFDCALLGTSTDCTNTSVICYDQYCNYVDCAGPGTSDLRNWLNQSMHSEFGSDIIALIVSSFVAIMAFMNIDKDSKNPTILFGTFMLAASVCSFVGLLTAWFLVLEGALIFVLIFWKVRGG